MIELTNLIRKTVMYKQKTENILIDPKLFCKQC